MEKTNNLKLNVWEKTDPILVGDFNEDNRKIDAAVGALTAGAVKIAVGSYVGNGDFDKGTTVNVGFPIKVLFLTSSGLFNGDGGRMILPNITVSGGVTGQVFWFTENGFRIRSAKYNGSTCSPYLNNDGGTYHYVAIG